jgi:peroxiredoxin
MPSMERLYRRYRDRGFTILALSIDTNVDAVAPFVRRYGLSFPVGVDSGAMVARTYGMRALPTTYLIDGRRDVVALAVGARNWDGPTAHAVVETLLR